jgi:hypothetical protein
LLIALGSVRNSMEFKRRSKVDVGCFIDWVDESSAMWRTSFIVNVDDSFMNTTTNGRVGGRRMSDEADHGGCAGSKRRCVRA